MKLYRSMALAGIAAAALVLAGCNQATSSGSGDKTPAGPVINTSPIAAADLIENFEGYADTAALAADWAMQAYNPGMTGSNVTLGTAAPLFGHKTLILHYGGAKQYDLTDLHGADTALTANLTSKYSATRTGIQLTIRRQNYDAAWIVLRGDNNANAFQAKINNPTTTGVVETIKIPFASWKSTGWNAALTTYTKLQDALAAAYAFTDITIEGEADDPSSVGALATLEVDDIAFY